MYERRVELWLAGFGAQRIVATEDVVAAIDRFPNHHLEGLRGVLYDPERATRDLTPFPERFGFSVKGAFFQVERCVVVYAFESLARFEHILYHEVGHHVFQHVLDSCARKEWVTRLYPGSRHVTYVASRNANEDFAESYAVFLREPFRLRPMPRKYAFIARMLASPGVAQYS